MGDMNNGEDMMNNRWESVSKKALNALLFGCTTLALPLSAGIYDQDKSNKPGPFSFAYPKDVGLKNPRDVYFYTQGLAFQAEQDGLDFMIKNKDSSGTLLTDAEVKSFSDKGWDYSLGGRIGIGTYLNHDAWNFDLNWTWLRATNKSYNRTGTLLPLWHGDTSVSNISARGSCNAAWDCYYSVVDAKLGKPHHISRKVIFNPNYGLRLAIINQNLRTDSDSNPSTGTTRALFDGQNDFWGLGARIGLDTEWLINPCWRFYCNAGASLLAGTFKTSQKMDYPSASSSKTNFDYNFHMNVPNMDLGLGIQWGTYLRDKEYYLSLQAGYEFQIWWNQLHLRRLSIEKSSATDFSLNGFTLKLQLDL